MYPVREIREPGIHHEILGQVHQDTQDYEDPEDAFHAEPVLPFDTYGSKEEDSEEETEVGDTIGHADLSLRESDGTDEVICPERSQGGLKVEQEVEKNDPDNGTRVEPVPEIRYG